MLTDSVLKFFRGHCGVECTVLRQRQHETSAERIEDKAIGYSMYEASGDSTYAGERLEAITGDGKTQGQSLAGPTLA
jgi:hypothetical protein